MFWFKKEPEKPNYLKIALIVASIITAVAAAGYGAYMFCKKKGIKCCLCKSAKFDEPECETEDEEISEEVEVEVEEETAAPAADAE